MVIKIIFANDVRVHIEFPKRPKMSHDDIHFQKKLFFIFEIFDIHDSQEEEVSGAINNKAMKIYEIAVFAAENDEGTIRSCANFNFGP